MGEGEDHARLAECIPSVISLIPECCLNVLHLHDSRKNINSTRKQAVEKINQNGPSSQSASLK